MANKTAEAPPTTVVVTVPAGSPPFAPAGYGARDGRHHLQVANPWPNPVTENAVREWVERTRQWAASKGQKLTTSAMRYYARHFWEMFSDEYIRVCLIIHDAFDEQPTDADASYHDLLRRTAAGGVRKPSVEAETTDVSAPAAVAEQPKTTPVPTVPTPTPSRRKRVGETPQGRLRAERG